MNTATHFLIVYSLIPDRIVMLLVPVIDLANADIQMILESHGQIANSSPDYDGEWMCNFVESNKKYHIHDSDSTEDQPPVPLPPNTTLIVTGFHL